MMRLRLAVLAVPLLAVALTGCGLFESTASDEETVRGVTEIRLDAGSARFTITGEDVDETTVRRELHYRWGDPEDSWWVEDGVLTLRGCGRNCSVDYTVAVPEGTPVSGHTSNGSVVLSNLGPVDVESSNGRIEVESGGPVRADTSNGGIDVTLSSPADVTAHTSNGSIDVTVPDGPYRVHAATSNGSTDIGVAEDSDAHHRLRMETSNGSITVTGR